MTGIYTGILLTYARYPLWNSPILPLLFLASALGTGYALFLFIVKFTNEGSISIKTARNNSFGIVEVVDTGKGIPGNLLNKLFSKHSVFDGGPVPGRGCGLGLYIAKQFMMLQHGDIYAKSAVGKGSSFVFKIPLPRTKGGNLWTQHSREPY